MGRFQPIGLLFVTGAVFALFAASNAPAKEGVRATLLSAIPSHARPGATITVRWSLWFRSNDGKRHAFSACGAFVRLIGTAGAKTTGWAQTCASDGRYSARVKVPARGISRVRIGLRGTTDVFFPITSG